MKLVGGLFAVVLGLAQLFLPSSVAAASPEEIRIFSSAEYWRRVARRISRIVFSPTPVPAARFCLIFAPSWATMSQKLSLMQSAQSVQ